jgi:hypothetical protein
MRVFAKILTMTVITEGRARVMFHSCGPQHPQGPGRWNCSSFARMESAMWRWHMLVSNMNVKLPFLVHNLIHGSCIHADPVDWVRRLYNHIMVTLTQNVANVLSLKCTLGSFDWASWGQEEQQQLISAQQWMLRQQYNTTEIVYFSKQISQFFFLLTHNSYLTDFCSTLFDQINCCSDCSTWCKTRGHREKHYDTAIPLNLFLQTRFHIFATISGASWI